MPHTYRPMQSCEEHHVFSNSYCNPPGINQTHAFLMRSLEIACEKDILKICRWDFSGSHVTNGLFHFLSIQRCGRKIPWGCARNIFQGSQGLKLSFQGDQGKFSRGVIPVRTSLLVGSNFKNWFPKGFFWQHPLEFQAQKLNLEIAFHTPCMAKKWNTPIIKMCYVQILYWK